MDEELRAQIVAQMERIGTATNAGSFDKETINDALAELHDLVVAPYASEPAAASDSPAASEVESPEATPAP